MNIINDTKQCFTCKEFKTLDSFRLRPERGKAIQSNCINCANKYARDYRANNLIKHLVIGARRRAKQLGVKCTIKESDFKELPKVCPVLGIPLDRSTVQNCPSIDRFIPELGYIPGNCYIVSYKANLLKSNGTVEEIEKVLNWMKTVQSVSF